MIGTEDKIRNGPVTTDKIRVTCPRCGHVQPEPRMAFSTICRKCNEHIHVQETAKPKPSRRTAEPRPELRRLTCFDCKTELEVAVTAQSTMCKRCSAYLDLKDYVITNAVSRNFKTKGAFTLEAGGYIFNTETVAGDAILKGRFLGKIFAERSLTIYSTAEIKGTVKTGRLIIPAGNRFGWKETLQIGGADIGGELAANLKAVGTVVIRSGARFFGDIEAGGLAVEDGAVVVGMLSIVPERQ